MRSIISRLTQWGATLVIQLIREREPVVILHGPSSLCCAFLLPVCTPPTIQPHCAHPSAHPPHNHFAWGVSGGLLLDPGFSPPGFVPEADRGNPVFRLRRHAARNGHEDRVVGEECCAVKDDGARRCQRAVPRDGAQVGTWSCRSRARSVGSTMFGNACACSVLGTRLHAIDNTQLVVGVHLLLARRER